MHAFPSFPQATSHSGVEPSFMEAAPCEAEEEEETARDPRVPVKHANPSRLSGEFAAKAIPAERVRSWLTDLFKCTAATECVYSTGSGSAFDAHLRTVHPAAPTAPCAYCGCVCKVQGMQAHVEEEHGACRFQCPYCPYRAVNQVGS